LQQTKILAKVLGEGQKWRRGGAVTEIVPQGSPKSAEANKPAEYARVVKKNPWKLIFRIVRWTSYAGALIALVLVLHKSSAPMVETSHEAAARAEDKLREVEKLVAEGQPATLRMDEAELNSYLASQLQRALQGAQAGYAIPGGSAGGAAGPGVPNTIQEMPQEMPQGIPGFTAGGQGPTTADIEQMRSNVKDVKVTMVEDRVRVYVMFDMHGKDMTLQLEGRLGAENGYLRFIPVSGQLGSLPIPQSTLETAVRRLMESPENREKLRLPADISDLRIENGEVVANYK
jgi:hypothetical protein